MLVSSKEVFALFPLLSSSCLECLRGLFKIGIFSLDSIFQGFFFYKTNNTVINCHVLKVVIISALSLELQGALQTEETLP